MTYDFGDTDDSFEFTLDRLVFDFDCESEKMISMAAIRFAYKHWLYQTATTYKAATGEVVDLGHCNDSFWAAFRAEVEAHAKAQTNEQNTND
jgi:hypothetical protein